MFLAAMLIAGGCSEYDDTRIREDLDKIDGRLDALEKSVEELNNQMDAVTELFNSSFVSLISTDASGNYVITYVDEKGKSHSITVATQDDVVTVPVVGIAQDTDGEWYWRQTADNGENYTWLLNGDGSKIRVGGTPPVVGIDNEGYWTVDGKAITNAKGDKVLANDVSNILFKKAYTDEKTGEAVFVLADGTELRMQLFEALGITFDAPIYTAITDYATKVKIKYTVGGSQSANAVVDIFTAYNVTAEIDPSVSTITVTMNQGAVEGNILVMTHANGNTVLKPLFFTFGSAEIQDPVYNGSTGDIVIEGELTTFEVLVSASIDYEVSVDDTAKSWLIYGGTRTMVTTKHAFTADYYEEPSGVIRKGEIRFSNALYNVSATIVVKQSPSIPQGGGGGIASAADLMAFAAAVNAGASTSRWQNEAGSVVLLNDIDMTAIASWTPIGGVSATGPSGTDPYVAVKPFTGIFDGQKFAIKNLNYTADVSGDQIAYALFGSLEGATVKNLILGDAQSPVNWTFTGTALKYTCCASLAAYAVNSTIEGCTNYYNLDFKGDSNNNELCILSGLVGTMKNSTIGGKAKSLGCINRGFVRTGAIANVQNGGAGVQTAGICGFMVKDAGNLIQYCVNYGNISCPTGRTGGIAATMMNGAIKNSDNRGRIEDDAVGQYAGKAPETTYNTKRMGGLVGGTDDLRKTPAATVESCTNYGDVITYLSVRTGGFIGHSNVQIIGCANKGAVLGNVYTEGNGTNRHGPGWACGYSGATDATWVNVTGCSMGGYVGGLEFKDNPTSAPAATIENAFCHGNDRFNPAINN